MKKVAAYWLSRFLAVFAVLFVTPESVFLVHKPEIPEELLKKQ